MRPVNKFNPILVASCRWSVSPLHSPTTASSGVETTAPPHGAMLTTAPHPSSHQPQPVTLQRRRLAPEHASEESFTRRGEANAPLRATRHIRRHFMGQITQRNNVHLNHFATHVGKSFVPFSRRLCSSRLWEKQTLPPLRSSTEPEMRRHSRKFHTQRPSPRPSLHV